MPNIGNNCVFPATIDGTFELEARDACGNMEFVAVEYAVPIEDLDNPGLPPIGFTGDMTNGKSTLI